MGTKMEMLFDGGKRKALTLSYDDGTIHDRRLVAMMNEYGIRGTFNLNSGMFSQKGTAVINGYETDMSRIAAEEVKTLYAGHEVASHTLTHPSLTALPSNMGAAEVLKDRKNLEELTGELVRGFAYPYGTYNETVEEVLSACGIEYARTVVDTNGFDLPADFLEWHPTCHHESQSLMEIAKDFCENDGYSARLFYLWGHSYEFTKNNNWEVMEEFCRLVGGRDDIWYATNIQIVDYMDVIKAAQYAADGSFVYNPCVQSLWLCVDDEKFVEVKGGQQVSL